MFKHLKPLLPYMRRYRRAYVWGGIVAVLSSAVWVFFLASSASPSTT